MRVWDSPFPPSLCSLFYSVTSPLSFCSGPQKNLQDQDVNSTLVSSYLKWSGPPSLQNSWIGNTGGRERGWGRERDRERERVKYSTTENISILKVLCRQYNETIEFTLHNETQIKYTKNKQNLGQKSSFTIGKTMLGLKLQNESWSTDSKCAHSTWHISTTTVLC